ncbi:flocculation protein FLO11-like [Cucumis melo var. makuwa]|uniref:Flocculation protein FLO11-like n=1 Tax=Cucumis melo var. makuwa TaxID=1194695 RepID=A0A5D3C5S4_CUCMM|nr:flocculation protein FLO11-like [Cucumis melo var. makuwa]
MVTTRFKKYSFGISSSKIPSTSCSSEAMDPTAPKLITSSKGKRYKGIPTKHPYKKVRKSILSGEYSTVSSPAHSSYAERSANPPSPVTVKEEVLEFSSPQSVHPSVSSSVPKSLSRPEPRVSVETVVLDSDSSDSDDNVILSTLLHRTRSARNNQTTSPAKPQASGGVSPKVAPPRPRTEEKTEAETTSTSTENHSASPEKDPSDHRSTEEPGESSIPRSTEGPSEFSTPVSTFHSEEGAHKWKYVVKRQIANEANIADRYNFSPAILKLIRNVGHICTVSEVHIRGVCFNVSPELLNSYLGITLPADYAVSYPTLERLAEELMGGTVLVWPVDGQLLVASLTVKYSILHQIGISNWIPSTHASTISTSLGHFVYLVGIGSAILTPLDIVGSAPRVIPLSMHLFQGTHFPNVATEFDNALGGTSTPAALQPAVDHPVTLSVSLANRLLQALIAESRALTRQISELTDRRIVLDAIIRDLRRAASRTTPSPSD